MPRIERHISAPELARMLGRGRKSTCLLMERGARTGGIDGPFSQKINGRWYTTRPDVLAWQQRGREHVRQPLDMDTVGVGRILDYNELMKVA